MGRRVHGSWLANFAPGLLALLWLAGLATHPARPDDGEFSEPAPSLDSPSVEERLLDLEQKYSALADENRRLSLQIKVKQPQ